MDTQKIPAGQLEKSPQNLILQIRTQNTNPSPPQHICATTSSTVWSVVLFSELDPAKLTLCFVLVRDLYYVTCTQHTNNQFSTTLPWHAMCFKRVYLCGHLGVPLEAYFKVRFLFYFIYSVFLPVSRIPSGQVKISGGYTPQGSKPRLSWRYLEFAPALTQRIAPTPIVPSSFWITCSGASTSRSPCRGSTSLSWWHHRDSARSLVVVSQMHARPRAPSMMRVCSPIYNFVILCFMFGVYFFFRSQGASPTWSSMLLVCRPEAEIVIATAPPPLPRTTTPSAVHSCPTRLRPALHMPRAPTPRALQPWLSRPCQQARRRRTPRPG